MTGAAKFLQLINNPFKLRLFLLAKLPSAFFSGVRVLVADEKHCVVSVPYKWFSKNPFRSTYFACLSMAAEMSSGVLALAHEYKRTPPLSMLVLKIQGSFIKKATGRTHFTCEDGLLLKEAIENAIASNSSTTFTAKSYGRNAANELVAEFDITWSFKAKAGM